MKKNIFTLIFICIASFSYAQTGSYFGPKDVLICDFEDVNLVVVDSLWTDTSMTTPITTLSDNISIVDNPFPLENESAKAAKYVRPEGQYKSIFLRFNELIDLSKTPYLQVQVYPIAGKSPNSTQVSINILNDKGDLVTGGGTIENIAADEWTTVTAFLGRLKSSELYNTIQITINATDSLSALGGTEYLIDQIGFKAPADGGVLPTTIFYETFGGYNQAWQDGTVEGQFSIPNADGTGVIGPGEVGTLEAYASIDGFTSGIPFKFKDLNADTAAALIARTWGMAAKYEGASGGGRIQFLNFTPGTLETGDIDVSTVAENVEFVLSFGFGTQLWWAYSEDIGLARPKVEISVDGGSFYEIFSESDFLLATGNFGDFEWGQPAEYEDQIMVLVEYPLTTTEGLTLANPETINLRMSYKAGASFWIDDLWLSAADTTTPPSVVASTVMPEPFKIYPNPASDYIFIENAAEVMITDLKGSIMLETKNTERIDISSLVNGLYIIKARTEDSENIGKFIKY